MIMKLKIQVSDGEVMILRGDRLVVVQPYDPETKKPFESDEAAKMWAEDYIKENLASD